MKVNVDTVMTVFDNLISYRQMLIKMNRIMYTNFSHRIAQRFEEGWLLQEYILSEQIREDMYGCRRTNVQQPGLSTNRLAGQLPTRR